MDMYQIFIIGPRNGTPRKERSTLLTFLHPDERRADELGRFLAQQVMDRTGHVCSYHVQPIILLGAETDILPEISEVIARLGGDDMPPRREVDIILPRQDQSVSDRVREWVDSAGLAGDVDSDWLIAGSVDQPDGMTQIRLSLPADCELQPDAAQRLSLYDDDARMEEIGQDAEDAAMNAWGPLGRPRHRPNPHPEGTEENEFWNSQFMSAYARHNDR